MTDLPIIFCAPMILSLIREAQNPGCDGGKTMTRRVLNPQPVAYENEYCTRLTFHTRKGKELGDASPSLLSDGSCPAAIFAPYQPGDRLWVRERAAFTIDQGTGKAAKTEWFFADSPNPYDDNCTVKSRPSIHMPRWASRLTLIVQSTKIERLQDITEADARAEGAPWYVYGHGIITDEERRAEPGYQPNKRMGFCWLWNELHGWGPPSAWDANPWVVAVSFRVILANIDSEKDAA